MMNSESFRWQRTGKVCNGLYDFGLLRDNTEENKPKLFSLYFSRTVLIVGILAAFTFAIYLILADKYQKSVNIPHHYASFVYHGDQEKINGIPNTNTDLEDGNLTNNNNFKKLQNITKNIQIHEINDMLPITTVLKSVNLTDVNRRGRKLSDEQNLYKDFGKKLNQKMVMTKPQNLAEILKRTELKPISIDKYEHRESFTNTEQPLQFAQLEMYKNFYTVKNLQELLKHINCSKAAECIPLKFDYNIEDLADDKNNEFIANNDQIRKKSNNDHLQTMVKYEHNSNDVSNEMPKNTEVLFVSDTNAPIYSLPHLHNQRSLDPFNRFRASNPIEINDLDESESSNHALHRFSNRIYHNEENAKIYSQVLDPFLKPPTPQPMVLSFTPSYTTAIFHGFNQGNRPENDQKIEASAEQSIAHNIKPVSLMVEIFPANDYQLPGSLFDNQNSRKQEPINSNPQANNPPWLPWRLFPYSQNKMRLFVNLFPQQSSDTASR